MRIKARDGKREIEKPLKCRLRGFRNNLYPLWRRCWFHEYSDWTVKQRDIREKRRQYLKFRLLKLTLLLFLTRTGTEEATSTKTRTRTNYCWRSCKLRYSVCAIILSYRTNNDNLSRLILYKNIKLDFLCFSRINDASRDKSNNNHY